MKRKTMEPGGVRPPLRARLRRAFYRTTGTHCRIECEGARGMMIQGCCGIEQYSPDRIVLAVRDPDFLYLCIGGRALLCSSYHEQGVQVTGEIRHLLYCRERSALSALTPTTEENKTGKPKN